MPDLHSVWSQDADHILTALETDPEQGLSSAAVAQRQREYGKNELQQKKSRSIASIIASQLKSIVIILLAGAAVLAILFSDYIEGLAILAVIAINAAIGFVTELRAVRSMEALRKLGHVDTEVIREGIAKRISADQLVPGDIVVLDAGDIVTADMRLLEAAKLQADESTLTGESIPVRKNTGVLPSATPVMERDNMVFKGTAITRGSACAVVTHTGLTSELGRIAELVRHAEAHQTPLEKRLNKLGERLAWAVVVMAVFIALIGVLTGRDLFLAIEVAIALAVAAIPEGLPIVATIALARGMWRMAKRQALISRLSAVETLGATSIILTDKTGTLTENRMTVTAVALDSADLLLEPVDGTDISQFLLHHRKPDDEIAKILNDVLTVGSLCSNASLHKNQSGEIESVGDPTEVALLNAASRYDLQRAELLKNTPEITEDAFDPDTKLMATRHQLQQDQMLVAVKGAPESVIARCTKFRTSKGDVPLTDNDKTRWLERADQLGEHGLRTLALASKHTEDAQDNPYAELTLLGITGLEDPPRSGVRTAVDRCRHAGIRVVMVTGDHAATARNIADALNITDPGADADRFADGQHLGSLLLDAHSDDLLKTQVYSRVTPEQKLNLIDFYQRRGNIVAMTGDGVNDAPALKKADIGVAMGQRGTAVAKEAAAMVLQDDNFATIVEAVSQGRVIFANIRKFVVYLLSCNISEVLIVSLATIAGAPLPLLPLQILFLNLVTDVFPALALGVGEGSPKLMKQGPRPADESILTPFHRIYILLHSIVIGAVVLGAMAIAVFVLNMDSALAVTVSFCTLALAQLWHVFNMREQMSRPFDNEIVRNKWVWGAIVLCLVLVLLAVYLPGLRDVLKLSDPGARGWLLIGVMSLVPLFTAPLVKTAALAINNKVIRT